MISVSPALMGLEEQMRALFAALVTMVAAGTAAADEARPISAIDVAVDVKELNGQTRLISDCTFFGANIDFALCGLGTPGGSAGSLQVATARMERDMLRFLLKNCASLGRRSECTFDVWATVVETPDGKASLVDLRYGRQ